MEETRIDRIDRYLVEFIQGIKEEGTTFEELRTAFVAEQTAVAELRTSIAESQNKTDDR